MIAASYRFPRVPGLVVTALLLASATAAPRIAAQGTTGATAGAPAPGCPVLPRAEAPTDAQRRAARALTSRAQEATIVADNATARDLYERAEKLDPTDAGTAYALARGYETAGDPRALMQYCRFLALAPNDASSADVRQRVLSLSSSLAARQGVATTPILARPRTPSSPGTVFALGLLFPGLGQYYTHNVAAGIFYTAGTAVAVFYALRPQTQTVSVTRTGTDPNGNPYQYQDVSTQTSHPNAFAGGAVAAGVLLFAATEAYISAARDAGPASAGVRSQPASTSPSETGRLTPLVAPIGARTLGVGVSLGHDF